MADEGASFLQDKSLKEEDPILNKFLIWCKENGLILSEKVWVALILRAKHHLLFLNKFNLL